MALNARGVMIVKHVALSHAPNFDICLKRIDDNMQQVTDLTPTDKADGIGRQEPAGWCLSQRSASTNSR